ncbi:rhodanese-like domain-containing protein [Gordonia sp. DT30]|uniref:rhodanese-like domain-containing protein n=1 Tax=unclassified Gordonia (in: high G+C Gram-positive bacteria) TaxID=2657482 RepID=UPI003CF8865D
MTASVRVLAPVSAPAPDAPLSLQATDYRSAIAAGATAVDIRSHRKRQTDGALIGALALDAAEALDLLTPGSPSALRSATAGARWILVSDDGHEAEWLTWHLQARGVTGAVFVVGGHRSLRRAGINGLINQGEFDVFSAH